MGSEVGNHWLHQPERRRTAACTRPAAAGFALSPAGDAERYRPTTFPRFHENLTFSTRLPILSLGGASELRIARSFPADRAETGGFRPLSGPERLLTRRLLHFDFRRFNSPKPTPVGCDRLRRSQPLDNPGRARQRDDREFGPEMGRRRADRVNRSGRARRR